MTTKPRSRVYTEAFQRQVVVEYQLGAPLEDLQRKYDLDEHLLRSWLEYYTADFAQRAAALSAQEGEDDVDPVRALEEKLALLRALKADLELENALLRASLTVHGMDPDQVLAETQAAWDADTDEDDADDEEGTEDV